MSKYKYLRPYVKITITTTEKKYEFYTLNDAVDITDEQGNTTYWELFEEMKEVADKWAESIRSCVNDKTALEMWDDCNDHKHVFINGAYIVSFEVEPEVEEEESDTLIL